MFRRRHSAELPAPAAGVVAVVVTEADEARRAADLARLRAVVDEAVVRQDQAGAVLQAIRERSPLARVSREGGPLASRFLRLRTELPEPGDADLQAYAAEVGEILHHHGMLVTSALDLLAVDWRSERIVAQLERLTGLGPPAERLDALRLELHRMR